MAEVISGIELNGGHIASVSVKRIRLPEAPKPGIDEIEGLRAELDSKLEDLDGVVIDGGAFVNFFWANVYLE